MTIGHTSAQMALRDPDIRLMLRVRDDDPTAFARSLLLPLPSLAVFDWGSAGDGEAVAGRRSKSVAVTNVRPESSSMSCA